MIYELQQVVFEYQDADASFLALNNINLTIEQGEFVAIVGASGSGKSTLMNLLGLLASPTSGSLKFRGIHSSNSAENQNTDRLANRTETDLAEERNRHIGFIFQHFALLPSMTALENILLPVSYDLSATSADVEALHLRAKNLLTQIGMAEKSENLPNELSGGQKQRVAICRALIQNPDVILADEPTGALDSKTTQEVLGILATLNAQGKTVIVITHDAEVAARARRIIEIRDGEIVADKVNEQFHAGVEISKMGMTSNVSLGPELNETAVHTVDNLAKLIRLSIQSRVQVFARALNNLAAHKLRSALTGLGLLIGVTSIIVIAGLGEVVQNVFNKLFYNSASSKAYIYFDRDKSSEQGHPYFNGLDSTREFPAFASQFEKYGKIRPMLRTQPCTVTSESQPLRATIQGIYDPAEFTEMDTPLQKGRSVTPLEFAQGAPVAVIGSGTVDGLFSKTFAGRAKADFPLGEHVAIGNCNMLYNVTIVGVLGTRDTSFGNNEINDYLYIPISGMLKAMGPQRFFFYTVLPNKDFDPRWLADNITSYLRLRSADKLVFSSAIPSEIIEKIRSFLLIIQGLTGFIGALCILVGGIGIMNIMIVTVTERVREIGIMKSLGARPFHVRNQFLSESVTLCVLAGLTGVTVGVVLNNIIALAVAKFVPNMGAFQFVLAPTGIVVGLGVSFMCGVGFGFLPALRAAGMEPAACLRDE